MAEPQEEKSEDIQLEDERKAEPIKPSETVRKASVYLTHNQDAFTPKGIPEMLITIGKEESINSMFHGKQFTESEATDKIGIMHLKIGEPQERGISRETAMSTTGYGKSIIEGLNTQNNNNNTQTNTNDEQWTQKTIGQHWNHRSYPHDAKDGQSFNSEDDDEDENILTHKMEYRSVSPKRSEEVKRSEQSMQISTQTLNNQTNPIKGSDKIKIFPQSVERKDQNYQSSAILDNVITHAQNINQDCNVLVEGKQAEKGDKTENIEDNDEESINTSKDQNKNDSQTDSHQVKKKGGPIVTPQSSFLRHHRNQQFSAKNNQEFHQYEMDYGNQYKTPLGTRKRRESEVHKPLYESQPSSVKEDNQKQQGKDYFPGNVGYQFSFKEDTFHSLDDNHHNKNMGYQFSFKDEIIHKKEESNLKYASCQFSSFKDDPSSVVRNSKDFENINSSQQTSKPKELIHEHTSNNFINNNISIFNCADSCNISKLLQDVTGGYNHNNNNNVSYNKSHSQNQLTEADISQRNMMLSNNETSPRPSYQEFSMTNKTNSKNQNQNVNIVQNQHILHLRYKMKQEQLHLQLNIPLIEGDDHSRATQILRLKLKQQELQEQLERIERDKEEQLKQDADKEAAAVARAQTATFKRVQGIGGTENMSSKYDSNNGKGQTSDQTIVSNNIVSFNNNDRQFFSVIGGNLHQNSVMNMYQEQDNNNHNNNSNGNIDVTVNNTQNITANAIIPTNLNADQINLHSNPSNLPPPAQLQQSISIQRRDQVPYPQPEVENILNHNNNNEGGDMDVNIPNNQNSYIDNDNDNDDEPTAMELSFAKSIFMQTIVTQIKILVLNLLVCLVVYWKPIRDAVFMIIGGLFLISTAFQIVFLVKKSRKDIPVSIEEKFDACESMSFAFFFAMLYAMGQFSGRSVVFLISYTPFVHVLLWRATHKPRPKQEFIVNMRLCFRALVFFQLFMISLRYDNLIQWPWIGVFVPAVLLLVGLVFYLIQVLILTIWHGIHSLCNSLPLAEFYGLLWGFISFSGYTGCYLLILIGCILYFEDDSFTPLLRGLLECAGCNLLILIFDLLLRNKIKIYIALSNRQKRRELQFQAETDEINRRIDALNNNQNPFFDVNSELDQQQQPQRHRLSSIAQSAQQSISESYLPHHHQKKRGTQPVEFKSRHIPFPLFMIQFSSTYFKAAEAPQKQGQEIKKDGISKNHKDEIENNNNNNKSSNANHPHLNNDTNNIHSNYNTDRISDMEATGGLGSVIQTQRELSTMQFRNNLNSEQFIQTLPNKKRRMSTQQVDSFSVDPITNHLGNLIGSPKVDRLQQQKTFALHKAKTTATSTASISGKGKESSNSNKNNNNPGSHNVPAQSHPQQVDSASIQSEKDGPQNCLVCFQENADVVLMPCGHGGICYDCASSICAKNRLCYLCRKTIENIYRLDLTLKSKYRKVIGITTVGQSKDDEDDNSNNND